LADVLHQFNALLTRRCHFEDFYFKGDVLACQWMVKVHFSDVVIDRSHHAIQGGFRFVFKLDHVTFDRTFSELYRIKFLDVFWFPWPTSIFWWQADCATVTGT